MENKDVFISYSRRDASVADKICAALDRAGISYFIDRQGIGGGMEFPEILAESILNCRLFLFLASSNSYASKFTNSEITFAFNEKPKNSLLPYIIDNSSLPVGMKFVFSGINWRNINEHPIETILIDDICRLLGKERSTSKAIDQSISQSESPEYLYQKGITAYDKKDYGQAVIWFRKAAEQGNAKAQTNLGSCYYYGQGVVMDHAQAVIWFRKAAVQGIAVAQFYLGVCYDEGYGVSQEYSQAMIWYRKAADQGYSDAQFNLALCYYYGQGVIKDYTQAVIWFRKAAEQGNSDAIERLKELGESL